MQVPLPRALPALVLLCALAIPAAAQTPAELPLDTWVTGVLTSGEEPEYRLPADYTGWIEIVLESGDFDTFAIWSVDRPDREVPDITNDDAEGLTHGTDSRIRVEVREPGEGIFRVGRFGSSGAGEYRLRASVIEGPAPAPPIAYGDDVTGTLADLNLQGELEQRYEFEGAAGEEVWVVLESEDFDPLLALSLGGNELARDDDGFGGLNSALRMALPRDGTYQVLVRSYSQGGGAYRLRVGAGLETAPQRLQARSQGRDPGPGGMARPGWDASVPSTFILSRQELVPAAEMPPELVMMPQELDWLVEDDGRLVNRALGFDVPSPGAGIRRIEGEDLLELRGDLSDGLFGVETPPTNFGVWAFGDLQDGDQNQLLVVLALKSDTPPDAEAVADFGVLFLEIDGEMFPLRWMDIQWEESRSVLYRFSVDRDISGSMRCTAGQDREPGGLVVCAMAMGAVSPEMLDAADQVVSRLRVR
jgi:hypothetical protein